MKNNISKILRALFIFSISSFLYVNAQSTTPLKEIKGIVIDEKTKEPLPFSSLIIFNSNISTVTNNDGKFLLKIPQDIITGTLVISHLGYEKKEIKISTLENKVKIRLTPAVTELNAVNIMARPANAKSLVKETLKKKSTLYNNNNILMTAFYRETIKKRRKNASLSEAVVKIHKQPYNNSRKDHIELIRARKNTNYKRLDTLVLKLQGGPFSNLYTDIVKYPEFIFTKEEVDFYDFKFDKPTNINSKLVYVVDFEQKKNIEEPMYYGKLYIDAETFALINAVYNLNVKNRELSSKFFVVKKPKKADVYPTKATYRVNYKTQNGKWHYAYSNILLTFKINWEDKLFNSVYTLNSEMAITDWEIKIPKIVKLKNKIMLRPSTILTQRASGFSDPRFWGEYNIIEPEKSIESAIAKIRKHQEKT